MKIRAGFVSNSSSSSFCIYGVCMDEEKVRKMMGIKDEDVDLYDIIDEVKNPLSSYTPYDDDDVYIGISWSEVKDDETGKQFKERTEAELEKLLGKKVKCETYEVAWSAY